MFCKKCGAVLLPVNSVERGWEAHCLKCGDSEPCAPVAGAEEAARFANQGLGLFEVQNFEEAEASFRRAAGMSDGRTEYRWAALLAKYGIRYCETDAPGKGGYTVNYWRKELPEELLTESAEFKALCRDVAMRSRKMLACCQGDAEEIDEGIRQIRALEANGERYDIFISFKDMDGDGSRTLERRFCDGLYAELLGPHAKVFYAPKSMHGRPVMDFEGYIYTALKTAKLMVLVGSSPENVNSPWVASEWKRFKKWGKRGQIVLCPVGDMKIGDFPRELRRIQSELAMGVPEKRVEDLLATKWAAGEILRVYDAVGSKAVQSKQPRPSRRGRKIAVIVAAVLCLGVAGIVMGSKGFGPGPAPATTEALTPEPTSEPTPVPYTFANGAIENAVREALGKPTGYISLSDLAGITELDLTNRGISDISDLSKLTNLEVLYLGGSNIRNINALKELTNLQRLYLVNSNISDISALKSLTSLQTLDLNLNDIRDISVLKELTSLQNLGLNNNNISDISALKELTSLQKLGLLNNDISDISALKDLTSLKDVDLRGNHISDRSPVSNLSADIIWE